MHDSAAAVISKTVAEVVTMPAGVWSKKRRLKKTETGGRRQEVREGANPEEG